MRVQKKCARQHICVRMIDRAATNGLARAYAHAHAHTPTRTRTRTHTHIPRFTEIAVTIPEGTSRSQVVARRPSWEVGSKATLKLNLPVAPPPSGPRVMIATSNDLMEEDDLIDEDDLLGDLGRNMHLPFKLILLPA